MAPRPLEQSDIFLVPRPLNMHFLEGTPVFKVSSDTQRHLVNAYSYDKEGVPKTYSNPNSRESRQFE